MTNRPPSAMPSRAICAISVIACLVGLSACGESQPDAYGNFEAREVIVAAEVSGQILRFEPDEGDRLSAGTTVGLIDTTTLALQRQELAAQRRTARTRTAEAEAQIGVIRAQLETAREEYRRTQRLFRSEAATAQQLNRAEGEVRVLEERIEVARAQIGVARQEGSTVEARIRQIEEQIRKSRIVSPTSGTVLTTYVEPGEFVQRGQPLYRIANLDTLSLRAYVSGAQLASLRIGGSVRVRVDAGAEELMTLPGRVVWVASEAEFTPTPIQTREERVDQVYAIEVRVPNPDGVLKIGMPGEVLLDAGAEGDVTAVVGPGKQP